MTTMLEAQNEVEGGINRREFLTYAWGAAMSVLALEGGAISYSYMAPRFAANMQGGKFYLDETILPGLEDDPKVIVDGRFWLVNTADGPKAMHVACTHLGCHYKWEQERARFGCPCHGSIYTKEGDYVHGPAPRSLDQFKVELKDGKIIVDTGMRIWGQPSELSPAKGW